MRLVSLFLVSKLAVGSSGPNQEGCYSFQTEKAHFTMPTLFSEIKACPDRTVELRMYDRMWPQRLFFSSHSDNAESVLAQIKAAGEAKFLPKQRFWTVQQFRNTYVSNAGGLTAVRGTLPEKPVNFISDFPPSYSNHQVMKRFIAIPYDCVDSTNTIIARFVYDRNRGVLSDADDPELTEHELREGLTEAQAFCDYVESNCGDLIELLQSMPQEMEVNKHTN